MFQWSYLQSHSLPHERDLPNKTYDLVCTTQATRRVPHLKQGLLSDLISTPRPRPSFWWRSRCSVCSFLSCFVFVFLLVIFLFSHCVVSSFSTYDLNIPLVYFSSLALWRLDCIFLQQFVQISDQLNQLGLIQIVTWSEFLISCNKSIAVKSS